ncbi:MAG: aspartyl protease family protein [bacterium]|jgi:hypothetical protein
MRTTFFIFVFLLMIFIEEKVFAQEQFVETDSVSCHITTFPFTILTGGIVIVHAQVNNYGDSLNFILDTGSGGISLDSSTVSKYNMPILPSDKTIKGIGGIRKVSFLYNASLQLPGLRVENLNFHVNDYSILSEVYGLKIDGIIGYSFFSRYIVKLDYDSSLLHVYSQGQYTYPENGHMLSPMFTSIPIQPVWFADNGNFSHRFYLDTGGGLNFLLSDRFVNDSAVLRRKRRGPFVTQAEGVGGRVNMRLTTVRSIRVGPYRFWKVPTLLFDDQYNVLNYPFVGGLIGNDILRRFNLVINYAKQEIHIIPNTHFGDKFDYAYTGLSMYRINDRIIVDDVVSGSPAAKAGFQAGDVIISVENNMSNDLQRYKELTQTTGKKITFIISRENKIITIRMRPVSIL